MDEMIQALLETLPEATLLIRGETVLAANKAIDSLFPGLLAGQPVPAQLQPFLQGGDSVGSCTIGSQIYRVRTVCAGQDKTLCFTALSVPLPEERLLAQLREQLQVARGAYQAAKAPLVQRQFLRLQRLLDNAQLCQPDQVCQRRLLDLREVCSQIAEEAEYLLGLQGTTLTFSCGLPLVMVRGDGYQLRSLLLNLLSNAAKAGEQVEIRLDQRQENVLLTVADNGSRLTGGAQKLSALFAQTGEIPVSGSGAGLGLLACERIAHMHNGRLVATVREGGGTQVTVSFPAAVPGRETLHSPHVEFGGGENLTLLGLSDILPLEAFALDESE